MFMPCGTSRATVATFQAAMLEPWSSIFSRTGAFTLLFIKTTPGKCKNGMKKKLGEVFSCTMSYTTTMFVYNCEITILCEEFSFNIT